MRPRGIPSWWVKIVPWYYTERASQPSRADELRAALAFEEVAERGRGVTMHVECSCPDNCGATFPVEFR